MVRRKAIVLDPTNSCFPDLACLGEFSGWDFQTVSSPEAASAALANRCEAVSVGLVAFMPPNAFDFADVEAMIAKSDAEWIALVAPEMLKNSGIEGLISRAFFDFHRLPVDPARLATVLGHAYGKTILRGKSRRAIHPDSRYGMVGRSRPMQELFRQIDKVLRVDAPVLISGESGTGKELVARAIHRHSRRAKSPFIAMNCAAIPAALIRSELFGHEKGAFTGAHRRHIGSIEAAHSGVLFLDEIGDLPIELQANLLRFLQEGTVVRVGSTDHIRIDVRVIAASHVDLKQAIDSNLFREDLYYRLNVLHLKTPSLRDRRDDIPLLAETIFRKFSASRAPQLRGFSADALRSMVDYGWPGNVRELINRIHSAMVMSEGKLISASDLGLNHDSTIHSRLTLDEARALLEREFLEKTLRENHNNLTQSARQLGVSRVTIYRMIERFGILL